MKYRLKLNSGRVVGPLNVEQIGELYSNGHLEGEEQCQTFPSGEWKDISSFTEINNIFVDVIKGTHQKSDLNEGMTLKRLAPKSIPPKEDSNKETFVEFKYDKNKRDETLEFNITNSNENEENDKNEIIADDMDETVIRKASPDQSFDKTQIVNSPVDHEKLQEKTSKEKVDQSQTKKPEQPPKLELDLRAETVVLNMKEDLADIKKEAIQTESRLNKISGKSQDDNEVTKIQIITKKLKSKKTFTPIITFVVIAIFGLLLFEEEEKVIEKPIFANFAFPQENLTINKTAQKSYLQEGLNYLRAEKYTNQLEATKYFHKSLNNGIADNPALGYLLLTYAKLFNDAKSKTNASRVLFKLVESSKSKQFKDINIATGAALFFNQLDKYGASKNIIENYLRLTREPSISLLSVYLVNFIDMDDIGNARKVFNKLTKIPNKNILAYESLYRFLLLDERKDDARNLLVEGIKKFPWSASLHLKLADFYFVSEQKNNFQKTIKQLEQIGFEKSPSYFFKTLEVRGLNLAVGGNLEQAQKMFKIALKYQDSDALRFKLSQLRVGGTQSVQNLILESKAIELMKLARKNLSEKNWELALSQAIDATYLVENYIPGHLFLAKMQISRGFYKDAIDGLKKLYSKFPANNKVIYSLVDVFIKAGNLPQAQSLLIKLSHNKFSETWEYSHLLGRVYELSGIYKLADRNYRNAIIRAPLNDDLYFSLATLHYKKSQYKTSRQYLQKALSLNPKNIDYHILFARLLHDTETNPLISPSDTAIGYLKSIEKTNPSNPKLLGQIAIYYHESGQVKFYETYKNKIEKSDQKDSDFYSTMLETSKADGNIQDVLKFSKELIKLKPGDLKTRLDLGVYFYEVKEYSKSKQVLIEILKRIESYPYVNYYLGRMALLKKDYKKAKEYGEFEIKFNKTRPHGYFVRAQVHLARREFNEARRDLDKAVSLDGNFTDALVSFAKLRSGQNFHEEANDMFKKALVLEPNNPEIHRELARSYRNIGQSSLALKHFKKYLELYPNAPDKRTVESIMRQIR